MASGINDKGSREILGLKMADSHGKPFVSWQLNGGKADKSIEALEDGLEDALTVMSLPEKYRKRLAITNMQERLNEEIRRRESVIRIFPNEASAMRLIAALLAEKHESWSTGKCYFDIRIDVGETPKKQAAPPLRDRNNSH